MPTQERSVRPRLPGGGGCRPAGDRIAAQRGARDHRGRRDRAPRDAGQRRRADGGARAADRVGRASRAARAAPPGERSRSMRIPMRITRGCVALITQVNRAWLTRSSTVRASSRPVRRADSAIASRLREADRGNALRQVPHDARRARASRSRRPTPRRSTRPSPQQRPPGRRGLLGAVVRAVPHGGARAGERSPPSHAGRYLILKVNTDAIPELGERFRIRSIPTMAVFGGGGKSGRTVRRAPGGGHRGVYRIDACPRRR